MSQTAGSSGRMNVWWEAFRPKTLPLALACIFMGLFLAAAAGPLNWPVAVLTVVTATLLQILSNLANDYGDAVHGVDVERLGPRRMVQSGQITKAEMKRAIIICALLAMVCGLAMVLYLFGLQNSVLVLVFLALGGGAVWAAIAYTASKNPYGYMGLGDLFVLIFFGWVGTIGTYFLQTLQFDWILFLPATSVGLCAVAVLNINNIRDIDTDKAAGKRSVPVRIGRKNAQIYHWLLILIAIALLTGYVIITYRSPWQFLYLISIPLLIRSALAVWRSETPPQVAPQLKHMSQATLIFVITFGIGQLL
ncbi:MAG: 1,4-dihydroxy-2-naphthoate polyprenyltransferase [Anaerolineae bacterium]|nr:1,4-dihydroxy-2-naphthoate polyprenyltransferase [Anaerolineae bacterium]MCO5207755.1 1,4-dihydroxy-2-naphthoate polyprenyltransferase [Anaerolineae bacterium]